MKESYWQQEINVFTLCYANQVTILDKYQIRLVFLVLHRTPFPGHGKYNECFSAKCPEFQGRNFPNVVRPSLRPNFGMKSQGPVPKQEPKENCPSWLYPFS